MQKRLGKLILLKTKNLKEWKLPSKISGSKKVAYSLQYSISDSFRKSES